MKIKRIVAALLSAAMGMTMLSACAGGEGDTTTTAETTTAAETVAEATDETTTAEAPADTSADTSAETTAEEAEAPTAEKADINIAALKGPTALGMLKIMSDNEAGNAANNYSYSIHGTADEITVGLNKGTLDIAAVPANLASVLYNNTDGAIQALAINTLGVLYVVENGETISSVEDLKGKTVYSTGKGTTPEFAMNYILSANGIDPTKDLTIEFKSESSEVAAMLAADSAPAIAVLPQPFVTTVQKKNPAVRIALNLTEEWDKISTDSGMVTGVVVARKAFLEENPAAVSAFLDEYKLSTEYVNANVDDAAALSEHFDIIPAAVAKTAIPLCNIVFIDGSDMKDKLSGYLSVLHEQNPKSVGGALPDDGFYYAR